MPDVGPKITSGAGVSWYQINKDASNLHSFYAWTVNQPGFLLGIGAWMRRSGSGRAKPQLAAYSGGASSGVVPSPLPITRRGYTDEILVEAGASSTGASYEQAIFGSEADASLGVVGAAVRLKPGDKVVLAIHNEANHVDIAIPPSAASQTTFRRTAPAGDPPNPFGTGAELYIPLRALWGVWEPAVAPTTVAVSPTGNITTTTPTFTATTTDPDRVAPKHDKLAGYWIELRIFGTTALIWQTQMLVPTSTERSSGNISRAYNGSVALTTGQYEFRVSSVDDAGAIGSFTPWKLFTIANLPSVDSSAATPSGKDEDGTVGVWSARWVSPSGLNANAVKVRVLSGAEVIRGGDSMPWATITPVAPGGTLSVDDTITKITKGVGVDPLPPGSYTWEMKAKDTAGGTSEWSDPVDLRINFPPNQPTGLRPISGTVVTTPPLVDWLISDPDADDVLGAGLVSEWKVTRLSTGGVLTGRTPDVDPATGRGYFQFTETQFPASGQYQIEVRGVDLSAESAGVADDYKFSGWSAPLLLEKVTANTVTINSPTPNQVLLTSSPQIAFSVSGTGMNFFRVELYETSELVTPLFGSGIRAAIDPNSAVYTVPSGILTNGKFYDVKVITLLGDIESYSPRVRFKIQFPTADIVTGVSASLVMTPWDYEPVTVDITWGPTSYVGNQFAGWVITRRLDNQPSGEAVVIAHLRSAATLGFRDYHAPPNAGLTYGVSQLRRSGSDIQQSVVSEVQIEVPLTVPVIASLMPERGGDIRSPVIMLSNDYAEGFAKDETTIPTWGTMGVPTLVRAPEGYGQKVYGIGFRIRTDARGTVQQHIERWRNIVQSGHPVSFRTETEVVYCRIVPTSGWLSRSQRGGAYEIALSIEQVAWAEAVAIET
jgi:hypothetical protein